MLNKLTVRGVNAQFYMEIFHHKIISTLLRFYVEH